MRGRRRRTARRPSGRGSWRPPGAELLREIGPVSREPLLDLREHRGLPRGSVELDPVEAFLGGGGAAVIERVEGNDRIFDADRERREHEAAQGIPRELAVRLSHEIDETLDEALVLRPRER